MTRKNLRGGWRAASRVVQFCFVPRQLAASLSVALLWAALIVLAKAGGASAQSVEEANSDTGDPQAKPAAESRQTPDLVRVQQLIVQQTNAFRAEHDLRQLSEAGSLNEAARYFADYMARTGRYGHTADGQRPSERAKQYGYDFCIVLENIAYRYRPSGFTTEELAEGFVEGWKNSPGHRENMLDPHIYETGVAVAQSETSGNYFAVQMFGRPKSQSIEFKVTNRTDQPLEYTISSSRPQVSGSSDKQNGGGKAKTFTIRPRITMTHARCRPPQVDLGWTEATEQLEPAGGSHYVIQSNNQGDLEITKQGT